jgi:hypothetical protein
MDTEIYLERAKSANLKIFFVKFSSFLKAKTTIFFKKRKKEQSSMR